MAAKSDIGESTPEQQAALRDLLNGHYREMVLRAVAETGTVAGAERVTGLSADTIERYARLDAEFAERLAGARRQCGEKVVSKLAGAVLNAPDEQLVLHPTGAAILINGLLPEWRPNAPSVNIYNDNRQLICSIDQIHQAMRELEASTQQALPAAGETTAAEAPIEADYTEEPPF